MSRERISTKDMPRQKWLELRRRSGLGGSDIPVVMGMSPFKSRYDLWLDKMGFGEEVFESPAMRRGTAMEPVIADLYYADTGRKVRRRNEMIFHPEAPMYADIDREIVGCDKGPGVLEIKCPGLNTFNRCKLEGIIPYYYLQLQHYLACLGWSWGSIAVFSAERWELLVLDFDRDEEVIARLEEEASAFWKSVLDAEAPDENVDRVPLPTDGVVVELASEYERVAERIVQNEALLRDLNGQVNDLKDDIAKDKKVIEKFMADAKVAKNDKWYASRSTRTTQKLDRNAFVKDHPGIDLDKYFIPITTPMPVKIKEL